MTDTNPRVQTVGGRELELAGFTVVRELRPKDPARASWKPGYWYEVEKDGDAYAILRMGRGSWHAFWVPEATSSGGNVQSVLRGGLGDALSTDADVEAYCRLVLAAPKALVDKYAGLYAAQGQCMSERNPAPRSAAPPPVTTHRGAADVVFLEQLQSQQEELAQRVASLEAQHNPCTGPQRQRAPRRAAVEERWVRLVDLDAGEELWRGPQEEFVAANRETAEIDGELAAVLEALPGMEIGSSTNFGGGAAPWMMVQRVEPGSEMMPPGTPIGIENPRDGEGPTAQEEYLMAPGRPGRSTPKKRRR